MPPVTLAGLNSATGSDGRSVVSASWSPFQKALESAAPEASRMNRQASWLFVSCALNVKRGSRPVGLPSETISSAYWAARLNDQRLMSSSRTNRPIPHRSFVSDSSNSQIVLLVYARVDLNVPSQSPVYCRVVEL